MTRLLEEVEQSGKSEKQYLFRVQKMLRRNPKMKPPDRLSVSVELRPGLQLFFEAFMDLTSTRYDADGPIPWDQVQSWAEKHRLDGDATDRLHAHIRAMDLAFLGWRSEKSGHRNRGSENGNAATVRGKHAPLGNERGAERNPAPADDGRRDFAGRRARNASR